MIADEIDREPWTMAVTKDIAAASSHSERIRNLGFLISALNIRIAQYRAAREKITRPPIPISIKISEIGIEFDSCLMIASSMANPAMAIIM